jgi:hypothetical protein
MTYKLAVASFLRTLFSSLARCAFPRLSSGAQIRRGRPFGFCITSPFSFALFFALVHLSSPWAIMTIILTDIIVPGKIKAGVGRFQPGDIQGAKV